MSDEYSEVVGYVDKFSLMSFAGNKAETFEINGVKFTYGFAGQIALVGYQWPKNLGGVITGNGQNLKIKYVSYNGENIIVYIEQIE